MPNTITSQAKTRLPRFKPRHIFLFVFTLLSIDASFASVLQPYEAVYQTKINGFKIKLKRRLLVQDSKITISQDAKKFLLRMHESSELLDQGDGLFLPIRYEHRRSGLTHKHDKSLVFNWTDGTVANLLKPDLAPFSIQNPSYDKLGFQTQMRLDMLRNPDKQQYEYTVTNGVRNREYTFNRIGEELLDTPLGDLRTVKFERIGDDDDREVFVWIAPDWDFLLVRIDETKEPGGKTVRLILKSAKIADRKVQGL